eukprot:1190993-Prorocentrum_minimum.AAC.1
MERTALHTPVSPNRSAVGSEGGSEGGSARGSKGGSAGGSEGHPCPSVVQRVSWCATGGASWRCRLNGSSYRRCQLAAVMRRVSQPAALALAASAERRRFAPDRAVRRYGELERRQLAAEVSAIDLTMGAEVEDTVRRMSAAVPRVARALEVAVDRCLLFTSGASDWSVVRIHLR